MWEIGTVGSHCGANFLDGEAKYLALSLLKSRCFSQNSEPSCSELGGGLQMDGTVDFSHNPTKLAHQTFLEIRVDYVSLVLGHTCVVVREPGKGRVLFGAEWNFVHAAR